MAALQDLLVQNVLPAVVQIKLLEWLKSSKEVNIFVTGKTGTGKSTLVNALFGQQIAKEGDTLDPETSKVQCYDVKHGDTRIRVWDSPGLQDGTRNESKYVKDVKRNCKDIDLFIYCVRMSEARFVRNNPDVVAMKKLTKALGKDVWNNAIFVLSFANVVIDGQKMKTGLSGQELEKHFDGMLKMWKETIQNALCKEVGLKKDVAEHISIVPTGHYASPELVETSGEYWLSRFWMEALYSSSTRAQPALIKLNEHRFKTIEEVDHAAMESELMHVQPLIIASKGAEIGAHEFGLPGMGFMTGLEAGIVCVIQMLLEQAIKNDIVDKKDIVTTTDSDSKKEDSEDIDQKG